MDEGRLTFLIFSTRTNRQIKCTSSNDSNPIEYNLGFVWITHF